MDADVTMMRSEAARCRRLAMGAVPDDVRCTLLALAQEYDDHADAMLEQREQALRRVA